MAQVKLNLQPPPNVDFVTGYPGIPPGPDRPQSSVKGAIEIRVPQAGVKAKWVRIELRKVETLPGEGSANTYYDYVGPSPVNLWSTSDEYGHLRSQDFPFSIRIPESIPPTIALNNRASIGYELLASVCTKGKRGFLRKAKSVVVSSTAPVIIDKHELHSTWPVYCQPETRHVEQDDVNLVVERNRTCFGPGDRISVVATVKSDGPQPLVLHGFEILLKEATIFRSGISPGKKIAPQVTQIPISENKVAVNATLYGGNAHTAELACMVPPNHTTPTLTSARHIDVTYTLSVRAVMGNGTQLAMDLPIVMSNWTRDVSFEAVSRIGPAPGLSVLPQGSSAAGANRADPVRGRPSEAIAATLPINRSQVDSTYGSQRNNTSSPFNTGPAASPALQVPADEFGNIQRTSPGPGNTGLATTNTSVLAVIPGRRSISSGGANPSIVPPQQDTSNEANPAPMPNPYQAAEEEKVRLFVKARERAAKVQGVAVATPPTSQGSPPPTVTASSSVAPSSLPNWLTADQEKLRLFEIAQAASARTQGLQNSPPPPVTADQERLRLFEIAQATAVKTQGLQASPPVASPPAQTQTRRPPDVQPSQSTLAPKPSAAAALYAEAIGSRNRPGDSQQAGGSSGPSSPPPKFTPVPHLTAEQEKAALKRYEEAKMAVDRTQNSNFGPIAYESLFPAGPSSQPPPPLADEIPPSFDNAVSGPSSIMAVVSEKERLRLEYEARDAAALAQQAPPPPVPSPPPPAPAPSTPAQYANAQEEKDALRRKFEARDAQMAARPISASLPPQRANGVSKGDDKSSPSSRSPGGSRPAPAPPVASGHTHVLSAAEEKAVLKAKYDGHGSGHKVTPQAPKSLNALSSSNTPPPFTPPPLKPRPPPDYIKETQEEDARLSQLNCVLDGIKTNGISSSSSSPSRQAFKRLD